MLKYLLPLVAFVFTATALAQTKLGPLFQDHMVLQQNDSVSIWGQDDPGKKISVTGSWGTRASAETDDSGSWKLDIETPSAGGPYSMRIKGSDTVEIEDVLIGEVWLCSGQSNMQMPLKGFDNQAIVGSQEATLNSIGDNIRVFSVERASGFTPSREASGSWVLSTPATVGDFSAVAYFFGKRLENTLDVPVGLITTSWGGSSAEAWTPKETLLRLGKVEVPTEMGRAVQQTPTVLYNAMMHPLIGYGIKGSIWYQGESNRNRADDYEELISAMVGSWRDEWGRGDFPFYFVQIAPFAYGAGMNSALLREAQLKTMQSLENSGMAVTLDVGDARYIHPREKKEVGDRLAFWALSQDYGYEGIEFRSPELQEMKAGEEGELLLTFGPSQSGLTSFGEELSGFEVAGSDRVFHPATAQLMRPKGQLSVSAEAVPEPVAVRYAFTNVAGASLFSTSGLPVSSFRTDDWEE